MARGGRARGKIVTRFVWEDRYEAQRWSIEAGAVKRALYGDHVRPLTDAERELIDSEPILDGEGLDFIRSSYSELSTCRGWNGYIPVTEIQNWCMFRGYSRAMSLRLVDTILRIDAAYVRQKRAQTPATGDNG